VSNRNKEIKITHDEWVNELLKPESTKPDGAYTLTELVEKLNKPRSTLMSILNRKVREKKLITGLCIVNGGTKRWYKPVKK
jgi:hypothetical protein